MGDKRLVPEKYVSYLKWSGVWLFGFLCCFFMALFYVRSSQLCHSGSVEFSKKSEHVEPITGNSSKIVQQERERRKETRLSERVEWQLEGADGKLYGKVISITPRFLKRVGHFGEDSVYNSYTVFNEKAHCFATFSFPYDAAESRLQMQALPLRLKRSASNSRLNKQRQIEGYKLEFENEDCQSSPLIDLSREATLWYQDQYGPLELPLDTCLSVDREVFKFADYTPSKPHFHPKSFCYYKPYRPGTRSYGQAARQNLFCEKCFKAETFYSYSLWKRFENVTHLFPANLPRIPVQLKQTK